MCLFYYRKEAVALQILETSSLSLSLSTDWNCTNLCETFFDQRGGNTSILSQRRAVVKSLSIYISSRLHLIFKKLFLRSGKKTEGKKGLFKNSW